MYDDVKVKSFLILTVDTGHSTLSVAVRVALALRGARGTTLPCAVRESLGSAVRARHNTSVRGA